MTIVLSAFIIDAWLGAAWFESRKPPIAIRRASVAPRRPAQDLRARSSARYWGKDLGGRRHGSKLIDECPAADKSYRKTVCCPAAVIEGAIRTKRFKKRKEMSTGKLRKFLQVELLGFVASADTSGDRISTRGFQLKE